MASDMKGQFYMVGALMIMMYIIFLSQVLVSVKTRPELPGVVSPENIFSVFQEIADEGGDTSSGVENFLDAIKLSSSEFSVACDPYAYSRDVCSLPRAYWQCGVNVTVSAGARSYATVTKFIQSRSDFFTQSVRMPLFFKANTTRNLYRISLDLSNFVRPPLIISDGSVVKTSCTGTTCSFKLNFEANPRVVYIYNVSGSSGELMKDIGVLNDTGYDASSIINELSGKYDYELLSLSDLGRLGGNSGPALLFLPSQYPAAYGDSLLSYVEEGGTLVAPYGLCDPQTLTCLAGSITERDPGTLTNVSGFYVNMSGTTSSYFTQADLPWAVNGSLSAIGALKYGEGWIVFVGNESFLGNWDKLGDFISYLVEFSLPPVEITTVKCPLQKP